MLPAGQSDSKPKRQQSILKSGMMQQFLQEGRKIQHKRLVTDGVRAEKQV